MLGLVVAERLYERFPDVEEGRLTQWRAHLVQGSTLARVAAAMGLGEFLFLGRGEEATGGRERENNLAHVYEGRGRRNQARARAGRRPRGGA